MHPYEETGEIPLTDKDMAEIMPVDVQVRQADRRIKELRAELEYEQSKYSFLKHEFVRVIEKLYPEVRTGRWRFVESEKILLVADDRPMGPRGIIEIIDPGGE